MDDWIDIGQWLVAIGAVIVLLVMSGGASRVYQHYA